MRTPFGKSLMGPPRGGGCSPDGQSSTRPAVVGGGDPVLCRQMESHLCPERHQECEGQPLPRGPADQRAPPTQPPTLDNCRTSCWGPWAAFLVTLKTGSSYRAGWDWNEVLLFSPLGSAWAVCAWGKALPG
ncbi:Hypothetical predicted protein [Marmota monax]|uniref:Uncharacterized protein n=1 Tax=Marmota monax TaxID=9995 RepID=A0A5E4D2B3_MARMO|nr:Hypothetical predicted protein [Marmota monax]